jgi:hypothetical protein
LALCIDSFAENIYMKKILLSIFASLAFHSGYSADNLPAFIKTYYTVKNALVSGDYTVANESAKALITTITASDFSAQDKSKLLNDLKSFVVASNINEQRKLFIAISDVIIQSAKQTHIKGVNVFFCPMKKAYWLGEGEGVKNPYYGNAMLTCGKLVETIK